MWNTQKIEDTTKAKLQRELGKEKGQEIFGFYTSARMALVEQVLPQIRAELPQYSDHGADHIADVLSKAGKLLDVGNSEPRLTALDLYGLILSILFHDAGNIFGRKDHQKKISRIYDFACGEKTRDKQEKLLVLRVTEAHTGEARDGTKDTLKELDPPLFPIYDGSARIRDIAAIVRFADELAEGPQRTSLFMHELHRYDLENRIHHEYARVSKVTIDAGTERVALTYNIEIEVDDAYQFVDAERLETLLAYIYKRIDKLNQERKYTKHYCDILNPMKRVTITFNFWVNGERRTIGLPEQLTLNDLVVPGDPDKRFLEWYSEYEVKKVIESIRQTLDRGV